MHTRHAMRAASLLLLISGHAVRGHVQYTEAQLKQEVTSLPGAPKVSFKMFSGYVDVGSRGKIFYWFVESQSFTPEKDPLLLWTNGGPGCSGLIGFLTENGPFRTTLAGGLESNPHAWNKLANMVCRQRSAPILLHLS